MIEQEIETDPGEKYATRQDIEGRHISAEGEEKPGEKEDEAYDSRYACHECQDVQNDQRQPAEVQDSFEHLIAF